MVIPDAQSDLGHPYSALPQLTRIHSSVSKSPESWNLPLYNRRMCGIVGEIGPAACGVEQLERMMGMLVHRGPDEAGHLLSDGVALGHTRLSIVDLSSGQQPMGTHDGRYWVTFNGEIYNHPELREGLEGLGHVFRTRSDTEVLLNSYREWGIDCLNRLNGQWAFALWDREDDTFLLARDRWGVRPLYYSLLPDARTIVFGSEIKALLADERVARDWDREALQDILCCWVCESDRTPLKAVRQIPPGAVLIVKGEDRRIRRWWELDFPPDAIDWNRSPLSWSEEIEATLSDACRLRLRADVPVGAYLSGGLDSSIIASLVRTCHQNVLETFSLSFSDPGYDESEYQRVMAMHLGTVHHQVMISRQSISDGFEKTIWHAETPIYRTAPAPMLHLSSSVRESGFKVVLTGEGADEMFAGYDQFKEDRIRRFWARNPSSKWRKRLLDRLLPSTSPQSQRSTAFWHAFFATDLERTGSRGYSHRLRWRNGMGLLKLLDDSFAGGNGSSERAWEAWIARMETTVPGGFDRWHALSKAQYWECRQLLSGYLLSSQGDRMAMANSVEGRYPFLDFRIHELARRIPPDLKLRGLREKFILKKAFEHRLPSQVTSRIKNPYRAPDTLAFLGNRGGEAFFESLAPASVARHGIFKPDAIAKLIGRLRQSPERSARDNMAAILAYSSHLFQDLFIDGPITPLTLPEIKNRIVLSRAGLHTNAANLDR